MAGSAASARALAVGILVALGVPIASAEEERFLLGCEAVAAAGNVRTAADELADHLVAAHGTGHPSAVVLADAVAGIAARLVEGLDRVEPRLSAFLAAWADFEAIASDTPFRDDPVLGPAVPGYGKAVGDLQGLLGCGGDTDEAAEKAAFIPCRAIPIAHFLAELAHGMDAYLQRNFGDSHPDALPRVEAVARTSRELHETLHDLEVAVPGTVATVEGLEHSIRGSSLVDTNEPEDVDVKRRLSSLRAAVDDLAPSAGTCVAPEGEAGHEGHAH